jgi:hypothetical protein
VLTQTHDFWNEGGAKKETQRRLLSPGSKVLDYLQWNIPKPDILLPKILKAVELCADVKDAKTGEIFFFKVTRKVHVNIAKHVKHVKFGCVSDMPGLSYYYCLRTKSGRKWLMCVRGALKLEGFHAHVRRIIPGFHT